MKTKTVLFASLSVSAAALVGAGWFWISCQQQSDSYDLSTLTADRVMLSNIPQEIVQKAAAREDVDAALAIAATQFGLAGDGLRTRLVRRMVADQIEQRFSGREIAEFYFNRVNPGSSRLHEMIADREARLSREQSVTEVANTQVAPVTHGAPPPEFQPLPPADAPVLPVRRAVAVQRPVEVRRAVAVADETPAPRALPVEPMLQPSRGSGNNIASVPVLRARPVGNRQLMARPALSVVGSNEPQTRVGNMTTVSPQTVYRIAVVDL